MNKKKSGHPAFARPLLKMPYSHENKYPAGSAAPVANTDSAKSYSIKPAVCNARFSENKSFNKQKPSTSPEVTPAAVIIPPSAITFFFSTKTSG